MNRHIRLFQLFILAGCSIITSQAAVAGDAPATKTAPSSLNWLTDYAGALDTAKQEHKYVLLDFTGSDWCVWCHRLSDEIFETPAFAAYAAKELVLVELDFPRKKELQTELKKQNASLAEIFKVDGYPTVILVSPEGEVLGRLGYMQGGPKTFIRELQRLAAAHQSKQAAP